MNSGQIKSLIENSNEPLLFTDYLKDWEMLKWSLQDWESKMGVKKLEFRSKTFVTTTLPVWEHTCSNIQMTMKEFIDFQQSECNDSWLYFDYKYLHEWFQNDSEVLKSVSWDAFGYPEKTGKDSTLWMGSKGAHTPCHIDTYGCNLIAQIYGRKQWIIFPPETNLNPCRVPYEESSVYSKRNLFYPNIHEFRGVTNARTVTLNPGDVLFLPFGWWHYVENLETAISVNLWIPTPQDNKRRIEEAFTQYFVAQLAKNYDLEIKSSIVNPNNLEILKITTPDLLKMLQQTIEIYQKEKGNSKKAKLLNDECTTQHDVCDFKETSHIQNVPTLSEKELISLLEHQQTKYNFVATHHEEVNKTPTIDKLINAVCHPEVLKLITEKLLLQEKINN